MQRERPSRRKRPDLLARPPLGVLSEERGWSSLIVDPIDQLRRLDDLRARGVLSAEEFDQQKLKVFGR
jgi:hypothetical protein